MPRRISAGVAARSPNRIAASRSSSTVSDREEEADADAAGGRAGRSGESAAQVTASSSSPSSELLLPPVPPVPVPATSTMPECEEKGGRGRIVAVVLVSKRLEDAAMGLPTAAAGGSSPLCGGLNSEAG